MNIAHRVDLAERELARICASIPKAQRAGWTQRQYTDEIKRAQPSLSGWLSHRAAVEGFFRKQRVIDVPPLHVMHEPYHEPSLDSLAESARKSWAPIRGELVAMELHKAQLNIEPGYQRNSINPLRVDKIAAAFDVIVFGSLTVASRDGVYYIVDGQNRWMAAQRRAEVDMVKCNVFKSEGIEHEARKFAAINMARAGVTPADKHRALVTGREEIALRLDEMLEALGIEVVARSTKAPRQLSAIGAVYAMAQRDMQRCEMVMSLVADLTAEYRIEADLIKALDYLDRRVEGGIENKVLRDRLKQIGCHHLSETLALARAANTGVKQLGAAVLGEVNKKLPQARRIILTEI
jgi:hypothetical protein